MPEAAAASEQAHPHHDLHHDQSQSKTDAAVDQRLQQAVGPFLFGQQFQQLPPVVRGLADYWIDKAGQGSGNQSQLCATRLLVKLAAGDLEWNKLRRTAVERAGVARGSKIAKAMEACK